MRKIHKKIISAILLFPLVIAITFCCCLDENASADETHSDFSVEHHQQSHTMEKADHSEHQHSDGDHECTCPKHLSFLSAQPTNIVLDFTINQMLVKNFMVNFRLDVLLASLPNHSQGPPWEEHLDHVSIPIYLKISNLRL